MKLCTLLLLLLACALYSTPTLPQNIHPAFLPLTAAEVRKEFEDYERKGAQCAEDQRRGRKCADVSFATEHPLNVPVQTGRGGVDLVAFRVSIATGRAQVRWMGYEFGILGRQRPPTDREDSLRRLITRMQEPPKTINFRMRLISRRDLEAPLPTMTFAIVNANQLKVWSSSAVDFTCPEPDLICRAALMQTGQSIAFPLFVSPPTPPPTPTPTPTPGATPAPAPSPTPVLLVPFVTDTMQTLRLLVTIDDREEPIEFNLRALSPS